MARRSRKAVWGNIFQKSMTAMTRSALRAGSRVVDQAVKAAIKNTLPKPARKRSAGSVSAKLARPATGAGRPAPPTPKPRAARPPAGPAAAPGLWTRGIALGPAGARAYRLYQPPGALRSAPLPLLVMLHGCGQTAEAFALSTRMNRLAAREGCCVLYPEQDRRAHPQGCWNWYATRSRTAYTEAATLLAMIDQVALTCPVDRGRVAVVGLSAGAGMAGLLASRYPARFAAVAMHSGVPPGVAHSSATALGAMLGTRRARPAAPEPGGTPWPPLLVIHGSGDSVVAAANGRAAAALWAEAAGAAAAAPRTVRRGQRHPVTVTDYKRRGRLAASLCEVDGLGHAWSGGAASQAYGDAKGPDASRMVWAFVARQFALGGAARG